MRALITGGCGYIGSRLAEVLIERGHKVSILDTFFRGSPKALGDCALDCAIVQGSVTNPDRVSHAARDCSVIYHLAARDDWKSSTTHPAALLTTNVVGTWTVLTEARKMGISKVVFTSSAAVYGDVYPGVVGGPTMPSNMYGASKRMAEIACKAVAALGIPEVVTLRLSNVYGRGGRGVVDKYLAGGKIVKGTGEQTRDFVHVDDVIRALIASWSWDSGIYNIATGQETSIMGLFKLVHGEGEEPIIKPLGPQDTIFCSRLDISRTKQLWVPKIDLPTLLGERKV